MALPSTVGPGSRDSSSWEETGCFRPPIPSRNVAGFEGKRTIASTYEASANLLVAMSIQVQLDFRRRVRATCTPCQGTMPFLGGNR